jgi:hypothetical protein
MKKQLWLFSLLLALMAIAPLADVLALPPPPIGPPPPPGGGGPTCWPPPCIPIDGGIGFLLAAGLAFGGSKLMKSSKKNVSEKI